MTVNRFNSSSCLFNQTRGDRVCEGRREPILGRGRNRHPTRQCAGGETECGDDA
jgi:hypothetical protein